MYPLVLGQKGLKAVDYMGALPIFGKYLNEFHAIENEKGYVLLKEPSPTLHGCRQEVMWALGESLSKLAPDVKTHFRTSVVEIDCMNTVLKTDGDVKGEFKFDLIIGADGVGSTVRKAMVQSFSAITATRVTGEEYAYTIYLDNQEIVGKLNPNKVNICDILGYPTVFNTLKHTNNKEGCGIVNMNGDIRDMAHAKQILKKINPILPEAMSYKSLEAFANFEKKNVGKKCWVSQYYHGDNFVLLGDAAHPFRPIGQGFNIAMLDGMWLDQAIRTYPHDIAKALRKFGDYSKLQGDACIHLSSIMLKKPKILN